MLLRMMVAVCALLLFSEWSFGQQPDSDVSTTTPLANPESELFADGVSRTMFFDDSEPGFWVTGEYVFGWVQAAKLPVLVTTSPAGTPDATAGVLPAATDVYSGRVNDGMRSGFRFGGGYTFDNDFGLGIEASFMFLGSETTTFTADQDDFPILARPYKEVTVVGAVETVTNEAILIANPDTSAGLVPTSDGSIAIKSKSGPLYDVNLDLTEVVWDGGPFRLESLFGYRYSHIADQLRIRQVILPTALPGTSLAASDQFTAQNNFHGVDMGLRGRFAWDNGLSLSLLAKLAAGNLTRTVDVRGKTASTVGAVTTNATGGVYALVSNIGEHRSSDWTVLPEFGATLQWQVRYNVRIRAGYSALLFNDVARADDQIDFRINPDLFPGPGFDAASAPQRPRFKLTETDIWIHTLNAGVDFTF